MNKILFSHSYFLRFDPKQWKISQPYAPLGTLFAAALMRENGYQVSLFDSMFAKNPNEVINEIEKYQPDFFVIYDDGFNYLTKMCLTNMREAAFSMIKIAKEKGCIVIVSSSDSTDHFDKYLQKGADFILIGEAELTLQELIANINQKQTNFSLIQGLAFKQNNQVIKTLKRNVIKDLDSLPLPAWDLIDINPYQNKWLESSGYFSMNIATTRGCPYKCNWCAKPIYGNRYNSRSPENVIEEIKLLKEKYQFQHIWFCDDIFGLKPDWVNQFASLVEKENLQFKFKIQSRADLLVQENYIKSLAHAGCDNVWMGAESGSQKILDAMDKGTTVEQIYIATKLLKQYHIKPSFFIQFGYLGETKEDIQKTIQMIKDLLPSDIGISVSYPLPGTRFYEKVKEQLKVKQNWTDSDELAMMYQATYPPKFYKHLHRHTHIIFNTRKSIMHCKRFFQNPLTINTQQIKSIIKLPYYWLKQLQSKQKLKVLQ